MQAERIYEEESNCSSDSPLTIFRNLEEIRCWRITYWAITGKFSITTANRDTQYNTAIVYPIIDVYIKEHCYKLVTDSMSGKSFVTKKASKWLGLAFIYRKYLLHVKSPGVHISNI